MPDASRTVTQSAVELFAKTYFESLGASIDIEADRWHIKLPAEHPISIDERTLTVGLGNQLGEDDDIDIRLTPESGLFDDIVENALAAQPLGSATFTRETAPVDPPEWLVPDPDTTAYAFYPLYDREALCFFFRVGVETVSEYQTELLRAVAIDLQTGDPNSNIAEGLLDHLDTVIDAEEQSRPDEERVERLLDTARDAVEAEVRPELKELQTKASDAAADEVTQYQQLQQQELQDIRDRLQSLEEELAEVSRDIEAASNQQERVQALSRRQELTDEQTELEGKRDRIQAELDAGFPEKRSEILDRHAIRVSVRPVAITAVSYERGDLELTVGEEPEAGSKTIAFAPGIGTLESIACDRCGEVISGTNPLQSDADQFVGSCCLE